VDRRIQVTPNGKIVNEGYLKILYNENSPGALLIYGNFENTKKLISEGGLRVYTGGSVINNGLIELNGKPLNW
jgi:hypothetical protein